MPGATSLQAEAGRCTKPWSVARPCRRTITAEPRLRSRLRARSSRKTGMEVCTKKNQDVHFERTTVVETNAICTESDEADFAVISVEKNEVIRFPQLKYRSRNSITPIIQLCHSALCRLEDRG